MKHYEAKVYSGHLFVGFVEAKSMALLKRRASVKCNNYYNAIDTMLVDVFEDNMQLGGIHFSRINKKYPNNTIERGAWK